MTAPFQIQWSLDNTIFKSTSALLGLLQATRDDDVQSAATLALEALGSGMLVCPERIEDGQSALSSRGRFELLQDVMVVLGLQSGGIAPFICKVATRCIPAFLLATSLKTFLRDEDIGNVFYEMLACQGLLRKPELNCSRGQLSKVVSALSGYSDGIIPNATVDAVVAALRRSADPSPDWMKRAMAPLGAEALAKIYSAVYGALRQDDVSMVTLEGVSGSLIVTSTLLWLQGDVIQVFADDQAIFNASHTPKISIYLSTKPQTDEKIWTIQEWREATSISTLVVTDTSSDGLPPVLSSFVSASTAKETLMAQYELSESQIAQVGLVATALVLVATERGLVTVAPSMPGAAPREIKLQNICQSSYLSRVTESMMCYGWRAEHVRGAEDFAAEIKEWTDHGFPGLDFENIKSPHPLTQRPLDSIVWILGFISRRSNMRSGTPSAELSPEMAEAAIYVATESLFSSLCSKFPQQRFFRVGNFSNITSDGAYMLHWIIRRAGLKRRTDTRAQISDLVTDLLDTITLTALRCNCMSSLLPGAGAFGFFDGSAEYGSLAVGAGIHHGDLAHAMNGYVAWSPQLRRISTLPRDVMAIEITAGYMRCEASESDRHPLKRIQASKHHTTYNEGKGERPPASNLQPFDARGNYIGLQPFPDTEGYQVKHYWHQEGQALTLRTGIRHPASGRIDPVDWISSIEAIAGATHLSNQHLAGFAERGLAETWKAENLWPSIFLVSAGTGSVPKEPGGASIRCISRSFGSEDLRFFVAGSVDIHNLYICHGSCSVLKCIQTALEGETRERIHAWDTFPGASREIEPWMDPRYAEQIVSPGWVILF